MIDIVHICKTVLTRLYKMDYEKKPGAYAEQLIFPNKIQAVGDIIRISEQELRLLFIEEFKDNHPGLFYSIETPTVEKYHFGKTYEEIKVDANGQSASLDMCIFERVSSAYNRILNIEFKHKNASIEKIGKDILKLIQEYEDGAFIHLLNNTDQGTFCNEQETGVFNKLYKSFTEFKSFWSNENKTIQLVILSSEQKMNKQSKPVLIHREIKNTDLNNLNDIFFINSGCGNIETVIGNGWKIVY